MKKFYAVIGRIPGDDEDSCYTYENVTRKQAVKLFEKDIYNDGESSAGEVADVREYAFKCHGVTVFINHVLSSDSAIEIA